MGRSEWVKVDEHSRSAQDGQDFGHQKERKDISVKEKICGEQCFKLKSVAEFFFRQKIIAVFKVSYSKVNEDAWEMPGGGSQSFNGRKSHYLMRSKLFSDVVICQARNCCLMQQCFSEDEDQ